MMAAQASAARAIGCQARHAPGASRCQPRSQITAASRSAKATSKAIGTRWKVAALRIGRRRQRAEHDANDRQPLVDVLGSKHHPRQQYDGECQDATADRPQALMNAGEPPER